LQKFCTEHSISRKTAHRWLKPKSGKPPELRIVGHQRSQHGKPTLLVEWSSEKPATARHKPIWARFQAACEKAGYQGSDVLARYLHGSNGDPDLLHAAIRLTFHDYCQDQGIPPVILGYMHGKWRADANFSSFVAQKLNEWGKPPARILSQARSQPFRTFWVNAQKAVRTWTPDVRPKMIGFPHDDKPSYRLVLFPRYRDDHKLAGPRWSTESVHHSTAAFTRFAGLYQKALRGIEESQLIRRKGKLYFHPQRARFLNQAVSAALAGDDQNALAAFCTGIIGTRRYATLKVDRTAALREMEHCGVPRAVAKNYLRAWRSRQESEAQLTSAAVRRVFCIGIGLDPRSIIPRNS
jgi:hypothetical protein